jgi:hypothetical protein
MRIGGGHGIEGAGAEAGIFYLARLGARKRSAFEFAFGSEPIVQIAAWLLAAFEIEFVGAKSYCLVRRSVPG